MTDVPATEVVIPSALTEVTRRLSMIPGPIRPVVQRVYDFVLRERLPLTVGAVAGVPALYPRLLDVTKNHPEYKRGLIRAIRDNCGDRSVTVVGLGRGVSTVHCLRAGATRVDAFEASASMIDVAEQTFAACPYDPTERVTVHHNVVGEAVEIYGEGVGDHVPVDELPANDVLVLDCEGAERSILKRLSNDRLGSAAIVETHPERGVPTDETRERLEGLYNSVSEREYMPEDDRGKRVFVARHD